LKVCGFSDRRRTIAWLLIAGAAFAAPGCGGQDRRIQQHRMKFESLGSTTAAIGDAWLAGQIAGAYTHTALEQTFQLVEQERTALVSSPVTLLDPQAAKLSQQAEQLSRLLAGIMRDVEAVDHQSARQHLAGIPIVPPPRP
jgi:hypothetical protein